MNSGYILAHKWHDKRQLIMLTTIHRGEMMDFGKRSSAAQVIPSSELMLCFTITLVGDISTNQTWWSIISIAKKILQVVQEGVQASHWHLSAEHLPPVLSTASRHEHQFSPIWEDHNNRDGRTIMKSHNSTAYCQVAGTGLGWLPLPDRSSCTSFRQVCLPVISSVCNRLVSSPGERKLYSSVSALGLHSASDTAIEPTTLWRKLNIREYWGMQNTVTRKCSYECTKIWYSYDSDTGWIIIYVVKRKQRKIIYVSERVCELTWINVFVTRYHSHISPRGT